MLIVKGEMVTKYRAVSKFLCKNNRQNTYWNFKEIILFVINIPFELNYKVSKDNIYGPFIL